MNSNAPKIVTRYVVDHYVVMVPGFPAFAETKSLRYAREQKRIADRTIATGHGIFPVYLDGRIGEPIKSKRR